MASYDDTLFRTQFPEFTNTTTYPAAWLSMYWGVATDFISTPGSSYSMLSGNSYLYALNLMTAHLLTIGDQNAAGKQGGFISSSSVDKVSVTKLAPPIQDQYEWWLASTPYGAQLAALLAVVSVGGVSIGGLPERVAFRKVGGLFL